MIYVYSAARMTVLVIVCIVLSCVVQTLSLGCSDVVDGHVVVPSSIRSITQSTFSGCRDLKTISFASPPQLRTIEDFAFENSGLTAIILPATVQIIAKDVFWGATSLASVTYNCSTGTTPLLLSVGANAFRNTPYAANGRVVPAASCRVVKFSLDCTAVVNGHVVVPSTVKAIASEAFGWCNALKTISFASPSQLRTIGGYAFGSSGLTAISIPATVQFISGAFAGAGSLTSVTYNCSTTALSVGLNTFLDTPYAASGRVVPAASCRVVNFPFDCSAVRNGHLVVPSSVKTIEYEVFSNCGESVQSIEFAFPSQVRVIESYAFAWTALTSIHFPASLEFIGLEAFGGANNLATVTYNCSTTPLSVGANAFSGTPYATNGLAVPAQSCRTINLPFDCSNVVNGNLHIIKSWKTISMSVYGFQGCTSLTSVTYDVDSQLESIGENAFKNAPLASIRIPATVQFIEALAFADSLLQTVNYDCTDQPLFISTDAFKGTPYKANGLAVPDVGCRRIEFALDATNVQDGHLIVPAATTRIDSKSFAMQYITVTSVTFEEGSRLKVIADYAFDSSLLTSIDIPMSVESIEDGAFRGSFVLSSMTFSCSSHSLTIAPNAFSDTALTSIALPPGAVYEGPVEVTALQCPTTLDCNSVVNGRVVVLSTVKQISRYAFSGCVALKTIEFEYPSQLQVIEDFAFSGSNLTSIRLPSSLEVIGKKAFNAAKYLASVTYECSTGTNPSPLSVGLSAFRGTPYLAGGSAVPAAACRVVIFPFDCSAVVGGHLVVPSSLVTIGTFSLNDCISEITTIEFASPSHLRVIERKALTGIALTSIQVPASVKYIGAYAFGVARSLASVTYECSNPPSALSVGGVAFYGTPYAASGSLAPDASCRVIELTTFDCSAVVNGKLVVPSSITTIKTGSFALCAALKTIEFAFPSHVRAIEDSAFAFSGLTAIHVPASVQVISNNAFDSAKSLATVTYECSSAPLQVNAIAFKNTPYATNGMTKAAASCRVLPFDCSDVVDGNYHIAKSWTTIFLSLKGGEHPSDAPVCASLTSVTYEEDSQLESFGSYLFLGSKLTSLRIPASVKRILMRAFSYSLLGTVTYECSDQPLFINGDAFLGTPYAANGMAMPEASCRKIEFALDATNVQDGDLFIPAVTSRIDNEAFAAWEVSVKSVTFEESSRLKVIAEQAFSGSYLTSVDIPMSVESIEDGAFRGSFALSSMTFSCSSHSLTIAANAFIGTALTSIALPPGAVYEGSVEVTALQCPTTLDCNSVVNGRVVVLSSVKQIARDAFSGCAALKTIEFEYPSQLQIIDERAFQRSGLTAIILPASLQKIGETAFRGASSLASVTYGCSSGTNIPYLSVGLNAFADTPYAANGRAVPAASCREVDFPLDCTSVVDGHVVVPLSVRSIKPNTFWGCNNLKTIEFAPPSQLRVIYDYAFSGCGLTEIDFPASLEIIGRSAFSNARSLTSVTYECYTGTNPSPLSVGLNAFKETPYATNGRAVPDRSCRALNLPIDCSAVMNGHVVVPSPIQSITEYAFSSCNSLKTISFASPSQLRTIERSAFVSSGLTAISIPASVRLIDREAFKSARSLTSVTYNCSTGATPLPLSIGVNAFADTPYAANGRVVPAVSCRVISLPIDCSAVVGGNLVVPSSAQMITSDAFVGCNALKTISFASPSQLRTIQDYAFGDSGLTAICIPASVQFIGLKAFRSANSLTSVTFNCSTTPLSVGLNAFVGTPYAANGRVVPAASCRDVNFPFDCASVVNGHLVVPSSVKTIESELFGKCEDSVTSIFFDSPSQLRVIESYAFAWTALTSIHFPASLEFIGLGAFGGANNLAAVTYNCSSTPLSVGANAFSGTTYNANGLAVPAQSCRTINLPFDCSDVVNGNLHIIKSWKTISIGVEFFKGGCTSLTSVTYDANSQLESIGENAFRGSRLVTIRIPVTVQRIGTLAFADSLLETVHYDCSDQPLFISVAAFQDTPYAASGMVTPAVACRRIEFALNPSNVQDGHLIVPAATTRIDSEAFRTQQVLVKFTSVTFEAGSRLKVIDDIAFRLSYLTSIDIPMSVESIGDRAFMESFALSSMTFSCSSHSLTIAANAFTGTALISIALPPGAVYEGPVKVTALQCPTTLDCNSVVNGRVVVLSSIKQMASGAFSFCSALKTVEFEYPSQLQVIGENAFRNSGLTSIRLPSSIRSIKKDAFSNCRDLKTIEFATQSQLQTIESRAFDSSGLTALDIPASVQIISEEAFRYAGSLSSVTYECSTAPLSVGANAFMNTPYAASGRVVPAASCRVVNLPIDCSAVVNGHAVVPSFVQTITSKVFRNCGAIKTISFTSPSQLRVIEYSAFRNSGLTAISIPASVQVIGSAAFMSSSTLTSVSYNCSTNSSHPRLFLGSGAFLDTPYAANGRVVPAASCRVINLPIDCSAVVNGHVVVPSSVKLITSGAFATCDALKTISFAPSSQLQVIEDNAFGNSGLTAIILPASLQTIGGRAFNGANSLGSVTYNCSTTTNPSPLSVGLNAFMNTPYAANGRVVPAASCRAVNFPFDCSSVINGHVVVPSSMKTIEHEVFNACSDSITSITFESPSQLRVIESHAFDGIGLTTISIPASVEVVGPGAFARASLLASVTYNCSSTPLSVGTGAFQATPYAANGMVVPDSTCRVVDLPFDCSYVVNGNLHIIKPWKTISLMQVSSNFQGCISLTSVTYDEDSQLESIGRNAFRGSRLATIRIPATVQFIAKGAFADTLLQTVTYDCSVQPLFISVAAFKGTLYEASGMVVPDVGCRRIEFALDATNMQDGHLIVPAATTRIDFEAFIITIVMSVTFEGGSRLKYIDELAFSDSLLTSIDIPMSVESIGDRAFDGSFALSSMTFSCSSHSLTIAANAFTGTALISIALPPGALYEGPVEVTALQCPSTGTVTCDAGQYLRNKGESDEACQACPAGKYTRTNGNRKKKCPRCPHGTYQPEEGQSTCLTCPEGFRSKGQRGGPNCYHKKTYRPMRPSDLLGRPEQPSLSPSPSPSPSMGAAADAGGN